MVIYGDLIYFIFRDFNFNTTESVVQTTRSYKYKPKLPNLHSLSGKIRFFDLNELIQFVFDCEKLNL